MYKNVFQIQRISLFVNLILVVLKINREWFLVVFILFSQPFSKTNLKFHGKSKFLCFFGGILLYEFN